jgi:hypothetical protein
MSVDRSKWPLMVRVALWGVPSRRAAWAFFCVCLAIGLASVAYGFVNRRFFGGGAFLFAALWYYLSIRWVDQRGTWS